MSEMTVVFSAARLTQYARKCKIDADGQELSRIYQATRGDLFFMRSSKWYLYIKRRVAFVATAVIFLLCLLNPIWVYEHRLQDMAFQRERAVYENIVIFAIDEDAFALHGPFYTWNKLGLASAIEILNSDVNNRPAVIAAAIIYSEPCDYDYILLQTFINDGNVVLASAAYAELANKAVPSCCYFLGYILPVPVLRQHVSYGVHNMLIDRDNVIRRAFLGLPAMEHTEYSMATAIVAMYTGQGVSTVTEGHKCSVIPYVGPAGSFRQYSFADIFEPGFNPASFGGKIVIIGHMTPSMAYSFNIPGGTTMRGVEIHANIVQMILEGIFIHHVSDIIGILIVGIILVLSMLVGELFNIRISLIVYAIAGVVYYFVAVYLFRGGHIIPLLLPLTVLGLVGAYQFVYSLVLRSIERTRVRNSFSKYLDPKLTDALIADQGLDTQEIGKKRNIAVLFVDVRGFTQMAESLRDTPELVVEILNDYLELTTSAIFKNGGSVDKFIGDATMALFNGFKPQEDYVHAAVKAAWDMIQGAETITVRIKEQYGIDLAYGIGIHCGDAIVGNIGSEFRKDYTAIGDMVNTASRLETNAGRSEVLISKDVYDILQGKILADSVGEMLLKGKLDAIEVFSLKGIIQEGQHQTAESLAQTQGNMLWQKIYETGNETVDSQHRQIFRLVQEVLDVHAFESRKEKIVVAMDFLSEYAVNHFASEEALMQESGYPGLAEHKAQHDGFVAEVVAFYERYKTEGDTISVSDTINDFVVAWLKDHIIASDKLMTDHYKAWKAHSTKSESNILWQKAYETGDETVDGQHKEIFRLVQEVLDVHAFDSRKEKIVVAMDFLSEYAVNHFASEEALMHESDYPAFAEHKAQHDGFVAEVVAFYERYKTEGDTISVSDTINDFVVAWLKEHIIGSDKLMIDHYKAWKATQ